MAHQGQEIAFGPAGFVGGGQRPAQFLLARLQQRQLAAKQRFAGDDAQIAPLRRDHETFDQGVGIFRQQGGAQIGELDMLVHDQGRERWRA